MSTSTTLHKSSQQNSKASTEESKDFNLAEFNEKLEKLSEEMGKLDNVGVEPGILDIILPTFGNILNTLMEKGTVQTRKKILKWTGSHFMEMKTSMDSDTRVNPFLNPAIIQHLAAPEINPDDKTLRNLRQLSTLHNELLNPKYFDKVEIAIKISKYADKILYGPFPGLQHPLEMKKLALELDPDTWDPNALAPTVRKLILDAKELNYLLSSKTKMIDGFNPLELISQITPYVTTLNLAFMSSFFYVNEAKARSTNLPGFIRQFINLKCLKLQTGFHWKQSDLDKFEKILMKIDSEVSGDFEIELELLVNLSQKPSYLEILFSPERCFITKNHNFSLNIPYTPTLTGSREIGAWTKIFTIANNLIPLKYLSVKLRLKDITSEAAKNEILNDFPTISPYIVDLDIWNEARGLDNLLFTSQSWPRLKKLKICSVEAQLLGLLALCPNLEKLSLTIFEPKSIFTNQELTDKENLKQIFGSCSNTLEKLTFAYHFQFYYGKLEKRRKIIPGSKLLKYLQQLLPNTLVEAEDVHSEERVRSAEDSESEESADS